MWPLPLCAGRMEPGRGRGREIQAFTAFLGHCVGGSAGKGNDESSAPMRTSDPADGTGVKSAVKWRWLRPAPGGSNRGWGSGGNRARFV